jgi:hypothetical protein
MAYWTEIRPGLKRSGKINLVPTNRVSFYRGFRSVYAFDDATRDLILDTNSTANLRGTAVYADTLFTDFDDHNPVDFRDFLVKSGLGYSEWYSGGRSYHFHIRLHPLCEVWLPQACKTWVRQHAPTADLSFYSTSGMYRLPGTFHSKYPGQSKQCLNFYDGTSLVLEAPEIPSSTHPFVGKVPGDTDFWVLLHYPKPPGQRTSYIWLLGTTAAEAGIGLADACRNILVWNSQQAQAHPTEYVVERVHQAYKRVHNGQSLQTADSGI